MSHLQTTSVERYGEHLRRQQREKEVRRKKQKEEEDPAVEEDLVASVDKSKEFTQKVILLDVLRRSIHIFSENCLAEQILQ